MLYLENQSGLVLWDGMDEAGDPYNDGVYFYHIIGEMLGGTLVDKHGFITLLDSK